MGMSVLANIHRQSTVAAATVFAGKPAPTWAQNGGWAQAVVGAGLPANGPAHETLLLDLGAFPCCLRHNPCCKKFL
ncbi:hypothetical protein PRJ_4904 [Pseudomonas sp. XWY-1]|nr:hypothetical protein PRJ_4904 [Pseudomonas sp. XWY-1]